jgi:hypothetical protein
MDLGLLLPVARPFAGDERDRIATAVGMGFSSLWLEEWPVGIGTAERRDHGTGHDPLVYSAHLGQQFRVSLDHIGFAALRLDYRPPQVTARALVSARWLGGCPLVAGIGCRTTSPETVRAAADDWIAIRACLAGHGESGSFLLPEDFEAPPMLLASRSPDLWAAIDYQAEGFMTTQVDPRKTRETIARVCDRRPQAIILLTLFAQVAVDDPGVFRMNERGALVVGERRLREFVRLLGDTGFTQLVYRPEATPTPEQLELVATCVRG